MLVISNEAFFKGEIYCPNLKRGSSQESLDRRLKVLQIKKPFNSQKGDIFPFLINVIFKIISNAFIDLNWFLG